MMIGSPFQRPLPWIGRRGCTGLPDRARKICLYFVFNEKPLRYPAIAQIRARALAAAADAAAG
jgi:hypothetical protein